MTKLAASVLILATFIAVIAVAPALNNAVTTQTSELPPSPSTPPAAAAGQPSEPTDAPTPLIDDIPPLPDSDLIVYNTLDGQIALI